MIGVSYVEKVKEENISDYYLYSGDKINSSILVNARDCFNEFISIMSKYVTLNNPVPIGIQYNRFNKFMKDNALLFRSDIERIIGKEKNDIYKFYFAYFETLLFLLYAKKIDDQITRLLHDEENHSNKLYSNTAVV